MTATLTRATPGLAERIDALTAFLPYFEGDDFGGWVGGGRRADGVYVIPNFAPGEELYAFVEALNENGWVSPFDWGAWQKAAAEKYFPDTPLLRRAPVGTLQRLLTLHIRKDRFVEGHLAGMAQDGHIAAILRRLRDIREGLA